MGRVFPEQMFFNKESNQQYACHCWICIVIYRVSNFTIEEALTQVQEI